MYRNEEIKIGNVYNHLTVIGIDSNNDKKVPNKKAVYYKCQCDCGNIISVGATNLRRGLVKSCGCAKDEPPKNPKMRPRQEVYSITGQKFGALTALERDYEREQTEKDAGLVKHIYYKCQCECGNIVSVFKNNLTRGATKSCGCQAHEKRRDDERFDLTGQVFDRWTVLGRAREKENEEEKRTRRFVSYYECQCECGNIGVIRGSSLTTGNSKSCGCLADESRRNRRGVVKDDLTGKTFGKLKVLERDFATEDRLKANGRKRVDVLYKCECECGNITIVPGTSLRSGHTKSCGCRRVECGKEHCGSDAIDLTGQVFGNIVILRRDTSPKTSFHTSADWIGECLLCGSIKSYKSTDLRNNGYTDCGCRLKERMSAARLRNNLVGRQFGHLFVKERHSEIGEVVTWVCQCNICGGTEVVSSNSLLNDGKDRCSVCNGKVSKGERAIMNILESNGLSFQYDKDFLDCRNPETGRLVRFDFIVSETCDGLYIIEFDGAQHFGESFYWDDDGDFKSRHSRDKYKNDWCKSLHIPIIRIPYTHLGALCIEDLMPSTTKFLVA